MAVYFNTTPFVKIKPEAVGNVLSVANVQFIQGIAVGDSSNGQLLHVSKDGEYYHFVGMFLVTPVNGVGNLGSVEFELSLPGVEKLLYVFFGTVTAHVLDPNFSIPVNFKTIIARSRYASEKVNITVPVAFGFDTRVVVEMFYKAE